MPEINYKAKYQELKQKYMKSVDAAFRLGYEQGSNDAQMQAAQQQQADQQAMQQASMAGQSGGQPGQPAEGQEAAPGGESPDQPPASAHPQGSELDQHISQLEGMLGKSELTEEDLSDLKKSISTLKQGIELAKSQAAIKGIAKALNKSLPNLIAPKHAGTQNLTQPAKNALSAQELIVQNLFKTWDEQEKNAGKSIKDILANEGLTKKV